MIDIIKWMFFSLDSRISVSKHVLSPLDLDDHLALWLWRDSRDNKVVITVRAVLVRLVKVAHVLPEHLLALLTRKHHLHRLPYRVVRALLLMALSAIKPSLTARGSDGNLGIQYMLAHFLSSLHCLSLSVCVCSLSLSFFFLKNFEKNDWMNEPFNIWTGQFFESQFSKWKKSSGKKKIIKPTHQNKEGTHPPP